MVARARLNAPQCLRASSPAAAAMPHGNPFALQERMVTQAALRNPATLVRPQDVLDALPSGVLAVGVDGRVQHANPRAVELLGGPTVVFPGARVEALLVDVAALDRAAVTGERQVLVRNLGADEVRLGWQVVRARQGGLVITFQDVSQVERLKAERDKLLQLATLADILPSVLHEIRNPVAAVISTLEVMLEDMPEGPVQEDLHAILMEVRRVALVVQGVGHIRGSIRSNKHHAVDQAVRDTCAVLMRQAKGKGMDLRVEVKDLPLLPLEPAGVRAITFNLLTNAIHGCRPGDIIRVSARLDGRDFVLDVADTGRGMSPEVLARCRDMFFTTRTNGSGIGLTLVHELAKDAGGSLDIQSSMGSGTTVTLRVPPAAATRPQE